MSNIAKKKNKITIEFIGNNAEMVTGSATLISFEGRKILFECGGIQEGKTIFENYKMNRKMLSKIKAKEIDMIIGGHFQHYDHGGNVCAIVKQNPDIRVITGINTIGILKEMWLDSAYISARDCEILSKQYPDKKFIPYYTEEDVISTLGNVEEYVPGVIHKLDENVSIRYSYSGHIFGAMQCELFITINSRTSKILFTSDLGNIKTAEYKPFVQPFEPVYTANIVIAETTYGSRNNIHVTKKIIEEDLNKIKSVVEQFCKDNHRRVLFPVFSLDKCPNILWLLYQMFKDDPDFKTKILIDSPLTNRLLDRYSEVLSGDAKTKFDEMMSWRNIIRVINPEESKRLQSTMNNICILSSGGMLQSGRSVRWAMDILPKSGDCIIFSGYCGVNTLGYKIKNFSEQKTINIGGKPCKNKCQIVSLKGQSSHRQRDDLINYYKSINCEKIYLVHGEMNGKIEFAEDLKKAISDVNRTTKVCVVNKSTTISL